MKIISKRWISFNFILSTMFFSFSLLAQIVGFNVDLFDRHWNDTKNKTPEKIHQENLAHLQAFIDFDVNTDRDDSYDRPLYISKKDADSVRRAALLNPVVSLDNYDKYDPQNKGIGFCFGRAMFVNVELAYRKIDRDAIKKAFVIGPMTTGGNTSWGWHVTTIAQSKDSLGNEIWWVIDPITGIQTLQDWYLEMYNDFSTDKKLKIYITDTGKFGPSAGAYHEEGLKNKFYNNYFNDMMAWFEEQSKLNMYDGKEFVEYNPTGK
jgi:hypothetical protein